MGPSAVAAISGSEPWRECGTRRHPAERPKSTPRYAAISNGVATGATSLTGSHDRLEAREPVSREPVKAASRRSRARVARALTGLRLPGSARGRSWRWCDLRSIGPKREVRGNTNQDPDAEGVSDRGSCLRTSRKPDEGHT